MEVLKGSNSITSRNAQNNKEKPKVEAIVSTSTIKKKSKVENFIRGMLSENIDNIGSYILTNIISPAVKDAIYKIGLGSWAALWDKSIDQHVSSSTMYHRASQRRNTFSSREVDSFNTNVFSYDELIYDTREEADAVLGQLCDILDQYPAVSVSDLYVSSRQAPNQAMEKWGWTDLTGSKVAALAGGGYTIRLPKAKPI